MASVKSNVIVVDDSPSVRAFFEQIGTNLDVQITAVGTAGESLQALSNATPDLIFLDIILPDKDGLTLLQELRKDENYRDTPVVIISSKDYAQDRITAKELGAVDFVPKPIKTQTIEDLIRKYAKSDNLGAGANE